MSNKGKLAQPSIKLDCKITIKINGTAIKWSGSKTDLNILKNLICSQGNKGRRVNYSNMMLEKLSLLFIHFTTENKIYFKWVKELNSYKYIGRCWTNWGPEYSCPRCMLHNSGLYLHVLQCESHTILGEQC